MSEDSVFTLMRPPARQTLADGITGSLRDAIFGGLFKPGQRLAEGKLASSLKVSRAPVREALASLEQEGLIRRMPSGGTTVTSLSRRDVEEICSLRTPLEALALRLAIAKGHEDRWAELADNIRASEETSDPRELAQMDLEFHEALVLRGGPQPSARKLADPAVTDPPDHGAAEPSRCRLAPSNGRGPQGPAPGHPGSGHDPSRCPTPIPLAKAVRLDDRQLCRQEECACGKGA